MKNSKIRKLIQTISLGIFLFLLWQTTFPLVKTFLPVDVFLRLDPLVATLVPLALGEFIPKLGVGLFVIVLALLMGRVFCGYFCPMGISLDVSHIVFNDKKWSKLLPKNLPQLKYFILIMMTFAALIGVSHIFWGSPIALITRFYALLVQPILLLMGNIGIDVARPYLENFDSPFFAYLQIKPRVFNSIYFVTAFFASLFILERIRPRFWCRYLCPAGALLSIFSIRALWRRRVHTCIACAKCMRVCPTGAIAADPTKTHHAECITCRNCVDACPVQGISFLPFKGKKESATTKDTQSEKKCMFNPTFLPSRRGFLGASAAGIGLATLSYLNPSSRLATGVKGTNAQVGCIRPPGARPEVDFLARCIRCGQCMKACPTNGLQPIWTGAGFEGVFSPILMSRVGPCEPECAVCGQVCPTEAIMPLILEEKQQAKMGTAVVQAGLCLAIAEGRSCVVCQEVCPFGAISLQKNATAKVPEPVVEATRCFGCGFCERHCPVHIPAIVIYPLNTLRLNTTDYTKAAKASGLDLLTVSRRKDVHAFEHEVPEGELPPGFSD